jgi:hypothetical protein
MRRISGSVLRVVMVLAMGGTAQPARAQDEPEEERNNPQPQPVFIISDQEFERWVFGPQRDADTVRRLLESRLKSRIEYIDHLHGITKDERKKLQLAGQGDIKRFFDRVEEARKQLRLAAADRIQFDRAVRDLRALSNHYESGIFNDQSMSAKTLKRILKQKPATQAERDRGARRISLYQSRLEWVALTLQKSLFLSDQQRQRLLTLLLEETRPPQQFGPFDYFGIVFQASELPESKLRPIFDDNQWRALRREFDNAKRLENMLRDNGYLPEDRPAEPRSAVAEDETKPEPESERTDGEAAHGAA